VVSEESTHRRVPSSKRARVVVGEGTYRLWNTRTPRLELVLIISHTYLHPGLWRLALGEDVPLDASICLRTPTTTSCESIARQSFDDGTGPAPAQRPRLVCTRGRAHKKGGSVRIRHCLVQMLESGLVGSSGVGLKWSRVGSGRVR
jgi:hypothetical protein